MDVRQGARAPSNFDPSGSLQTEYTSFSMRSSLTAVRQGQECRQMLTLQGLFRLNILVLVFVDGCPSRAKNAVNIWPSRVSLDLIY